MLSDAVSAAFGRLCVETFVREGCGCGIDQPPSGGCVLKQLRPRTGLGIQTAAFGRLCVETESHTRNGNTPPSAAFGRLCVETSKGCTPPVRAKQPPSGGCVLKPVQFIWAGLDDDQPPSGGCVLKPSGCIGHGAAQYQPPSGGCVLKHGRCGRGRRGTGPAAFGRLCVETVLPSQPHHRPVTSRLRAAVC